MGSLVVIAYPEEHTAEQVLEEVKKLVQENLLTLEDAAVVTRKGDGKPKIKQAQNLVGASALGGAFWGMLIGLIFWMPWLGLAVGALSGAISGKLADIGIDDRFIKEVGESLEPGGSALFLLVIRATADKAIERVAPYGGKIIHTSLSKEQEDAILEAFGQS